jgi:hypothetical protein
MACVVNDMINIYPFKIVRKLLDIFLNYALVFNRKHNYLMMIKREEILYLTRILQLKYINSLLVLIPKWQFPLPDESFLFVRIVRF